MRPVPRHATWLTSVFLLLLPLAFFWRETLGWLTLGYGDILAQFFPTQIYAYELLRQGVWPLWQPQLYSGTPLFARWQQGLLDPVHLLYWVGVTARTLSFAQELSFSIALLSTFVFARSLGLLRRASVFAAVVYSLSGYAVAHTIYPGQTRILALTPLLLFCVERLRQRGRWREVAWGALVVAWQLFAGHPQPVAYAALLTLGYAVFRAFSSVGADLRVCSGEQVPTEAGADTQVCPYIKQSVASWRFLGQCAVLYALGAALAAVQLLPAWELSGQSVRQQATFDFFTQQSLHPLSLLNILFPFLHGQGSALYRLPYWGVYWTHNEVQVYLGVLALALASAAVRVLWRAHNGQVKFWSAVAALGVLCALGKYVWPLAWLLYQVPLLNGFRSPNRHWMEVALAVAMLAGFALDHLLREEARQIGRTALSTAASLTLLCAGCAIFVLRYPERAEAVARALPNLQFVSAGFLRAAGAEFYVPVITAILLTTGLAVFLYARARRHWYPLLLALLLVDYQLYAAFAPINSGPRLEEQVGRAIPPELSKQQSEQAPFRYHLLLKPDAGEFNPFVFAGHEMATGYDPLLDARYRAFTGINEAGRSERWEMLAASDRTLDLLNVRYLLVPSSLLATAQPALGSVEIGGIVFAGDQAAEVELRAGQSALYTAGAEAANQLAVVSTLANSADLDDGKEVAEIRVTCASGAQATLPLRAGVETAEWAYDRADVRTHIKHTRPAVAESWRGDEAGSFQAHSYLARLALPEAVARCSTPRSIKITARTDATLNIRRVALHNVANKRSLPVSRAAGKDFSDVTRWRAVELAQPNPFYGGLRVYENLRVQPRVWLAHQVEARTEADQLRLIRGEIIDGVASDFDPARTALVTPETAATLAPSLLSNQAQQSAASASAPDTATITSRTANALTVAVETNSSAILVLSEITFPGWKARVDGQATELLRVDYLLRGIALSPGKHSVKIFYQPASLRLGLLVSSLAALGWCLVFFRGSAAPSAALRPLSTARPFQ